MTKQEELEKGLDKLIAALEGKTELVEQLKKVIAVSDELHAIKDKRILELEAETVVLKQYLNRSLEQSHEAVEMVKKLIKISEQID